jgi:hypothetical protein
MLYTTHETGGEMIATALNHRFAGGCIAFGSAVLVITIAVYLMLLGGAEGSGPGGAVTVNDAARHIIENATFLKVYWLTEAAALSLLAISGLALQSRQRSAVIPTGWFWTAFGIGAAVNLVMYGYTLGVYPEAAAAVHAHPALLQTARDASYFLFFLANALMMLGLVGVYLGEALSDERVLPRWLALSGVGFSGVALLGAIAGLIVGASVMGIVGPVALVSTLINVALGVRIAAIQ